MRVIHIGRLSFGQQQHQQLQNQPNKTNRLYLFDKTRSIIIRLYDPLIQVLVVVVDDSLYIYIHTWYGVFNLSFVGFRLVLSI